MFAIDIKSGKISSTMYLKREALFKKIPEIFEDSKYKIERVYEVSEKDGTNAWIKRSTDCDAERLATEAMRYALLHEYDNG